MPPYAEITKMTERELKEVAELHCKYLNDSFLSSLGSEFLRELYSRTIGLKYGACYVYKKDSKIVGFIVGTTSTTQLFKDLIFRSWIKFAPYVIKKGITNPRAIAKAMQSILYPTKAAVDTNAELLSIVVLPEYQRKGVGIRLVEVLFKYFKRNKIHKVKVVVDKENILANKFYKKIGFEFVKTIEMYDKKTWNLYIYNFPPMSPHSK